MGNPMRVGHFMFRFMTGRGLLWAMISFSFLVSFVRRLLEAWG